MYFFLVRTYITHNDADWLLGKTDLILYRAYKWDTIHSVTPRDWSLLGTKRGNWGLVVSWISTRSHVLLLLRKRRCG